MLCLLLTDGLKHDEEEEEEEAEGNSSEEKLATWQDPVSPIVVFPSSSWHLFLL